MIRHWILALSLFGLLILPSGLQAEAQPLPTLELLQDLIRIDTTVPPGNEIKAVRYVENYLAGFGISSEVIESAPGRGNLIARLPASPATEAEPLLLLAHLDVVTADPQEWSHPPFGAEVADGYLYGRGAIDMKGMAALMINTFVQVHLQKLPLSRDLLLVLVADEEAGGKFGTEFLVDKHWDQVKAGVVMNEGSIGFLQYGLHLYPIQVAEKGVAWLKLTAEGISGHGSMPTPDNATVHLIRALNKISEKPQPIQKTAIVQELLNRLSANFPFPQSFFMKHLFDFPIRQLASSFAGDKIGSDKILNAMLRNTVVPTVLQAGSKTNVIPATAVAQVDCRILPGETPKGFKQKIIEQIDNPKVQVELIMESMPNETAFNTPYFTALESAIKENDPKAIVFPFISPGATDNRFFRDKGVPAYGIIPLRITMAELEGLHGKDERIAVEQIPMGEKILLDFVKNIQKIK